MSPPDVDGLRIRVRRARSGVWAFLAVCALAIAALGLTREDTGPAPDSLYSSTALCLAAGSILIRRVASAAARTQRLALLRSLSSPLLAGALGALGLVVALREGAILVGLLYTLAGAFLSLGQPRSPTETRTLTAPRGGSED